MKDAIRCTFCYDETNYTEGVRADCNRLTAEGFELVERRNSWDREQYKGINSRREEPAGVLRGNMDNELFEITEDEAQRIVERIRRTVAGEQ